MKRVIPVENRALGKSQRLKPKWATRSALIKRNYTDLITASSAVLNPPEDVVEGLFLGTIKTRLQQTIATLVQRDYKISCV